MSTKQGPAMSKMNELDQDIQYMLSKGYSAADISQQLEIPTSWVLKSMQELQEDCGPFATINS
jgi:predicted ArsR family transcriptional regulator